MAKGENITWEGIKVKNLLDRYLRLSISNSELTDKDQHLDEDLLTAFVEGNLEQRENKFTIKHLVNCTFCRHKTVELIKLEMALGDEPVTFAERENQPSKVSDVLSGLLSKVFGGNEGAVFAHQEKEEKAESEEEE